MMCSKMNVGMMVTVTVLPVLSTISFTSFSCVDNNRPIDSIMTLITMMSKRHCKLHLSDAGQNGSAKGQIIKTKEIRQHPKRNV